MIDSSARGESMMRPAPNFSYSPCVARKTPPRPPTASPPREKGAARGSSNPYPLREESRGAGHRDLHLLANRDGVGVVFHQEDHRQLVHRRPVDPFVPLALGG